MLLIPMSFIIFSKVSAEETTQFMLTEQEAGQTLQEELNTLTDIDVVGASIKFKPGSAVVSATSITLRNLNENYNIPIGDQTLNNFLLEGTITAEQGVVVFHKTKIQPIYLAPLKIDGLVSEALQQVVIDNGFNYVHWVDIQSALVMMEVSKDANTTTQLGGDDTTTTSGNSQYYAVLRNPLGEGGIESFTDFIARILNIVMMIGLPIIVLIFIWTGFLYVKAQGDPTAIGKAHKALLWTVVGAALIIGSGVIANAIKDTVTQIGQGQ